MRECCKVPLVKDPCLRRDDVGDQRVIPAQAGILLKCRWRKIPAYAGMTVIFGQPPKQNCIDQHSRKAACRTPRSARDRMSDERAE